MLRITAAGRWLCLAAAGLALSLTAGPAGAAGPTTVYLPQLAQAYLPAYQPAADVLRSAAAGRCDWEAGVLALGWLHAWHATQISAYFLWAQTWDDACRAAAVPPASVNDGLLGYAAVEVFGGDPQPERLAYAQSLADWLMAGAPRLPNGTLTHIGDTVWDDTLLGTVPLLVAMSQATGEAAYAEEAYRQLSWHAQLLQDPATGLYHHAWSEGEQRLIGPQFWGRGNGWVMLATVTALAAMPANHPLRPALLAGFQRHAAALAAVQAPDGRWHTVVDQPDTYLETSGTALIGYGLERGVQAGWLPAGEFAAAACAAARAVWRQAGTDGVLGDVSAPTGPMPTAADYNLISHTAGQLYGQGAALLLERPEALCPAR